MKKNSYVGLPAALVLGLTVSASSIADHHNAECNTGDLARLTIGKHHIALDKSKKFCVTVGGTIDMRVKLNPDLPTNIKDEINTRLTASEKVGSAVDIDESGNSYDGSTKIFRIKVDSGASEGEEGEFLIDVDGVGSLDPRVKIIPSQGFDEILAKALDAVLIEEFNMTLAQAAGFFARINSGPSTE